MLEEEEEEVEEEDGCEDKDDDGKEASASASMGCTAACERVCLDTDDIVLDQPCALMPAPTGIQVAPRT